MSSPLISLPPIWLSHPLLFNPSSPSTSQRRWFPSHLSICLLSMPRVVSLVRSFLPPPLPSCFLVCLHRMLSLYLSLPHLWLCLVSSLRTSSLFLSLFPCLLLSSCPILRPKVSSLSALSTRHLRCLLLDSPISSPSKPSLSLLEPPRETDSFCPA